MLVHFTAPTIHAGFDGTITLELMNFGKNSIIGAGLIVVAIILAVLISFVVSPNAPHLGFRLRYATLYHK